MPGGVGVQIGVNVGVTITGNVARQPGRWQDLWVIFGAKVELKPSTK